MFSQSVIPDEKLARVLALFVGAKGPITQLEWEVLDRFDTYSDLGVTRERFAELAQIFANEFGASIQEHLWLRTPDRVLIDEHLSAISDPEERSLLCRLGDAALREGGTITDSRKTVFEHALAHWRQPRPWLSETSAHAVGASATFS